MIIREDYYRWDTSQISLDFSEETTERVDDFSGIGILCLKYFLNRIDSDDTPDSLPYARGFLVTLASGVV